MNLNSIRARVPMDHEQQVQFRYIAMQQGKEQKRRDWLDKVLEHYEIMDFGNHPAILTSRATSDFDIIIFGGEDFQRLSRFIREHGLMLLDKVKMCVCLRSDPVQRARLLSAGFDDVIDIRRIAHGEFLARARAILERYRAARQRRLAAYEDFVQLVQASSPLHMSAKQRSVLTYLLQAPGGVASCEILRHVVAADNAEPISLEHLQVLISQIRRCLQPGYRIVLDAGVRYRLIAPCPPHGKGSAPRAPLTLHSAS